MKKTWRQWWRWTVLAWAWRLRRRAEYRIERVARRVWPWSLLQGQAAVIRRLSTDVRGHERALAIANKTIAELELKLCSGAPTYTAQEAQRVIGQYIGRMRVGV